MEPTLKILFVLFLLGIFYQDLTERKVTLIVLFLCGLLGGVLHYQNTTQLSFVISTSINSIFLGVLTLFLWGYTSFKMKKTLFKAIGLGDFLFFFVLAISFSTLTFFVLFATSLLFSLLLFLLLKPKLHDKTVPLAGFQALFVSLLLVVNELFSIVNMYAL